MHWGVKLHPIIFPPKLSHVCHHVFQYVNLRTRYSELTTLTSQYIKFILETQRRLEEEEVNTPKRFRQSPTNIDSLDLTYLLTDVWENNLSSSTLDTD